MTTDGERGHLPSPCRVASGACNVARSLDLARAPWPSCWPAVPSPPLRPRPQRPRRRSQALQPRLVSAHRGHRATHPARRPPGRPTPASHPAPPRHWSHGADARAKAASRTATWRSRMWATRSARSRGHPRRSRWCAQTAPSCLSGSCRPPRRPGPLSWCSGQVPSRQPGSPCTGRTGARQRQVRCASGSRWAMRVAPSTHRSTARPTTTTCHAAIRPLDLRRCRATRSGPEADRMRGVRRRGHRR